VFSNVILYLFIKVKLTVRFAYWEVFMTVNDVKAILEACILSGEQYLDKEVHTACGADMMSDVLAFVKDQSVLLTGLCNPQVIRTAEMMDIVCIVFVRGKKPDESMITLAEESGIVLLSTEHRMFSACGMLYEKGLHGGASD
jgi:predicted transcriptional regulator